MNLLANLMTNGGGSNFWVSWWHRRFAIVCGSLVIRREREGSIAEWKSRGAKSLQCGCPAELLAKVETSQQLNTMRELLTAPCLEISFREAEMQGNRGLT